MNKFFAAGLFLLYACASPRTSGHPYIPPRATYSGTSAFAAVAGTAAAVVGTQMAQDDRLSARSRNVGRAVAAAGVAFLGAALIDAFRVEAERRRLMERDEVWWNQMRGSPVPDSPFRPPVPPPPEIPWRFEEESPSGGGLPP